MHHLTRICLRHPRWTLAILLVATVALGLGLSRFRTEFGFRVLIGDEHPAIQRLDSMIEQFGGGFPTVVAWECGPGLPCAHALDERSLDMANHLTKALGATPGVHRVHGPANTPILVPTSQGFDIRRMFEDGRLSSDAADLAALAVEDEIWKGELISDDGLVAALVVQPIDSRSTTDLGVINAIETELRPYEEEGFRFALEGAVAAQVVAGRELAESTRRVVPLTVLVIGLVVFVLLGSWRQTAIALATMAIALVWTFGLMGWLNWPQDGIHEVLAPLILVVGVCDAMHLLSRIPTPATTPIADRVLASARDVGPACVVTTLTTAGAFLSFVGSDLATFQRFGILSCFGTLACLLLTFTLLPVAASRSIARAPHASLRVRDWNPVLDRIVEAVRVRSRPTLAASAALLAFFGVGWAAHLDVGTSWDDFFGADSTIRQWTRFVESRLRPVENVELQIALPADQSLADPDTLHTLNLLHERIGRIDGLGRPRSILNRINRANRLLHSNDPRFEHPGSTLPANAEILELLTLGSPDEVRRWVSLDGSRVRISAMVSSISNLNDARIVREVEEAAHDTVPATWVHSVSGQAAVNSTWVRDVQATQLRSFPSALLVVSIILLLHFRNPFLTLAALLPTLLPVVIALGSMGWLGFSLDVGRAMIGAVLLGIGVDDAVHLLTHYKREVDAGSSSDAAIHRAIRHCGPAIVTTSAALSLGFLALMASAWQTISSFGLLVSVSIVGALASTVIVLPAAVFSFRIWLQSSSSTITPPDVQSQNKRPTSQ